MSGRFERVAVMGLGLLGGSVAWGARERRLAAEVVGLGRSADRKSVVGRIVDRLERDPETAADGADLLVLATPIGVMAEVLRRAGPRLAAGAIVTDVGSVKGPLAETLPGLLPPGVGYVGAHPMAGSHERGVEHARPDLLEGAVCVLCPAGSTAGAEPVARVAAFFRGLGARIVRRDPAAHDAEVAWISHVPHAVAFAFARALEAAPRSCGELVGPGFRDFTRIAGSDPALWAEILVANRKELAGPLARVAERLGELARAVEAGDAEGTEQLLDEARAVLRRRGR